MTCVEAHRARSPRPRAARAALLTCATVALLLGACGPRASLQLELVDRCGEAVPAAEVGLALVTSREAEAAAAGDGSCAEPWRCVAPAASSVAGDGLAALRALLQGAGALLSAPAGSRRSLAIAGLRPAAAAGCASAVPPSAADVVLCGVWSGALPDDDTAAQVDIYCPQREPQRAGSPPPERCLPCGGTSPAPRAIARVEVGQGEVASGTQARLTFSAQPAAGELLVAAVVSDRAQALSAPRGWSAAQEAMLGNTPAVRCAVYYRVAAAGDPPSYAWSIPDGGDIGVVGARYAGLEHSAPLEQAVSLVSEADQPFQGTGTATTQHARALLVGAVFARHYGEALGSRSWTQGFVEQARAQGPGGTRIAILLADRIVDAAGAFETTATWGTPDAGATGMLVAFRGAAAR